MRYKTKLNIINKALEDYKKSVNDLELSYNARKALIEQEADKAENQGIYTADYIKEMRNRKPNTADIKSKMSTEREKTRNVVNDQIESLKKGLDAYFNAPISPEFASKIQTISAVGLKLSNSEFEMLANSAHSYLELRMLNQLAESRTKTENKPSTKDVIDYYSGNKDLFHVENSTNEKNDGYIIKSVEIPDMDGVYKQFKEFENYVGLFIDAYCGDNFTLHDLLDGQNAEIFQYSISNAYFTSKKAEQISKTIDGMNAIIPKSTLPLTAEEKGIIDKLIPYEILANKSMIEGIIDDKPETEALFERDSRYSKYLSQAD